MSIIIVEGIPGCGKTTFCKSFASINKNAVIMEEWVDEKSLVEYLDDMPKNATSFQYEAQMQTIFRLGKAFQLAESGKIVLIDRGLLGNRCFAEVQFESGYISEEAMDKYRKIFNYDKFKMVEIETWYLQCEIDTALMRIKQRNRNGESSYSSEYLTKLKNKHDELLSAKVGEMETKIVDVEKNLKVSSEGLIDSDCFMKLVSVK